QTKTIPSAVLWALLIGLSSAFSGLLAQSNSDKNGTTAAQFLKIGVGARPMAMGGAYAAMGNDASAMYWNPSGITGVERITLSGVHSNWFADIKHQFMGFVLPIDASSAIGVYGIFLSMDPIQITTIDQPHGTGEFYEASDLAIGVSYARRPVEFLSLGLSAKFIHQQIHNETASTVAFDIGSTLDIPWRGLKLGMNFSNFGGKMKLNGRDLIKEFDLNPDNTLNTGVETRLNTQGWDLPVNFRVGLSTDLMGNGPAFVSSEIHRLTLSVDGNHPGDAVEHVNVGLEYSFNEILQLRGGYRSNRDLEKFFYGIGLNIPTEGSSSFTFDYALASFGELDYVHIFSGSISL
ncbi:MAG: PorV/PorQ family protein, partial [Calditrichaeota bacterium]|nr:PorV/PorQ family protein [Calditrichota bacterium]